MEVFTPEQLSQNITVTPQGFLLCKNVPIARTGVMPYIGGEIIAGDGESPLEPGPDGYIWVHREPDVVFSPMALASFEGASTTNDHPDEMLDPDNWGMHATGHAMNVRRGEGALDSYIVADLLVKDRGAIKDIQNKKRQVSCGYDATYEQVTPGHARMVNMIGNHIALVEKGRCGPTCAIGDSEMYVRDDGNSVLARMRAAFASKDQKQFDDALKAFGGDESVAAGVAGMPSIVINVPTRDEAGVRSPDNLAPDWFKDGMKPVTDSIEELKKTQDELGERMNAMDAALKDRRTRDADGDDDGTSETTDEEGDEKDEKTATKDSADTLILFRKTVSFAEILAPGITMPTMDAAASVKSSKTALCKLRRAAVKKALTLDSAKDHVTPLLMGRTLDKLPCSEVATIFNAGAILVRNATNDGVGAGGSGRSNTRDSGTYTPPSNADRNAAAAAFWNKNPRV